MAAASLIRIPKSTHFGASVNLAARKMRVIEEPEFYLRNWRDLGQLSSSQFLERMDKRVQELTLDDKTSQLSNLDQIHDEATLQIYLHDVEFFSAASIKVLKKAGPVLFRMLVYLSRYPFLPPPNYSETPVLTPDGLLRAVVLVNSKYSDQFLSDGNYTRAHTPADHCRMLFQGLATPCKKTSRVLVPLDEQKWRAKADKRAQELGSPERQELFGDWARTNRSEDGDEIFHDLVDIMFLTQPDGPDMPPHVRRDDLMHLAKELVADDGLCPDPLLCFVLERSDFSAVVQLLLAMHLGLEGDDPVPDDFDELRDRIVQIFFEEGRKEIDFDMFHDAFASGRTNFVSVT